MTSFDKIIEIFKTFPGIGPRQAKRFAYHIAKNSDHFNTELIQAIEKIKKEFRKCDSCHRLFPGESAICKICNDKNRDSSLLMIVANDYDVENIEKSKIYNGQYFVLGGLISLTNEKEHLRTSEFINTVKKRKDVLKEIVLALNATSEGDITIDFLRNQLLPILDTNIKISVLGRGFSTGSEIEYADTDTVKHALTGRRNL